MDFQKVAPPCVMCLNLYDQMANDENSTTDDLLPELNCFFLTGSRHDRERVEIQIGFDGLVPAQNRRFGYDVDFLLFVPRTLGLFDVDDNQILRQEFQSYVRLHSHVSNPYSETSLLRVKERFSFLKNNLNFENLRFFAIEFEGFIKGQTKRAKKRPEESRHTASELPSILNILSELRQLLVDKGLFGLSAEASPRGTLEHDLLLLNEYVSHVYVQYLVEVLKSLKDSAQDDDPLVVGFQNAMVQESQVRLAYNFYVDTPELSQQATEDEEVYLRRISLLKKYFQKTLFVSTQGKTLQTRMLIPVYGISAAIAATWAIMVQIYQVTNVQQKVGINSILLIATGIAAYVAKDIMKDFFRKYFLKKSSKLFPDFDKKLFIRRKKIKRLIGNIKEYIRTYDSTQLPEELSELRYSVKGGEIERYLNEDVLHFKKEVDLDLKHLETHKDFPWGMREIMRYRFDRLLHSMEDPYKKMNLLTNSGAPSSRLGHRLYHVYICTWIRPISGTSKKAKTSNFLKNHFPSIKPAFKAFRITLDKTGILDCKQMEWRKGSEIPPVPL
jgi:hypothetical protein